MKQNKGVIKIKVALNNNKIIDQDLSVSKTTSIT